MIQKDMGHRAPRRERRLPSLAAVEASAVHPTQGVCLEQLAWGGTHECMAQLLRTQEDDSCSALKHMHAVCARNVR